MPKHPSKSTAAGVCVGVCDSTLWGSPIASACVTASTAENGMVRPSTHSPFSTRTKSSFRATSSLAHRLPASVWDVKHVARTFAGWTTLVPKSRSTLALWTTSESGCRNTSCGQSTASPGCVRSRCLNMKKIDPPMMLWTPCPKGSWRGRSRLCMDVHHGAWGHHVHVEVIHDP
jgi:hypothetical protein